ncbi:mesoderm induction early response protein 2 [Nephila pilipes]|uniref:Mesoderm induction early response protein 2 n=1 Tax=Nephila pilipes TaxID=299642 RepID=A0A8X6Q3G8_NEPPI|nr:mesoderm induction early response protein 2 [Nephila pilipes]
MIKLYSPETENSETTPPVSLVQIEENISKNTFAYWKIDNGKNKNGTKKKKELEKNKVIRVGEKYQCVVPDLIQCDDEELGTEKDTLLWNPNVLSESETNHYLETICCQDAVDVEKGLWLLHRCKYDVNEAIRRHRSMPPVSNAYYHSWTESERNHFERGFKLHGKNFTAIQKMVRSKGMEDIIQYYYSYKRGKMKKQRQCS